MEKDLKNLLIDELHDLLSAEEQIVEALPKMVKAAESPELKHAFESHLKETKEQVHRLEKIFKILKVVKKQKVCKAAKGLIQECKDVLNDYKTKSPIRDAALISKAQRIEHYEIAAYGTIRAWAKELDIDNVADLLHATLNEEGNADKTLTKIAEGGLFRSGINQHAILPTANRLPAVKRPIHAMIKTNKPATKRLSASPKPLTGVKRSMKTTSKRSGSTARRSL